MLLLASLLWISTTNSQFHHFQSGGEFVSLRLVTPRLPGALWPRGVCRAFANLFGFGGGQQQQQEARDAARGALPLCFVEGLPSQVEASLKCAGCADYLCPGTTVCVDSVLHCPCPSEQDIRCPTSDASFVCVRGQHECDDVLRALSMQ